jgi:hypothetical protein
MRALRVLPLVLAVVTLAAGCGRTVVRTVTVTPSAATGDQRLYGRIASLERAGRGYELRFDPAWFLSGVTANVAQAQDAGTHCKPSACPPVANDNYVVDESHRLLTFVVPAGVKGTVLTRHGSAGGPFPATRITVAELAELVAGTGGPKLFEPLSSGVWIVVRVDTVRSFAQQYVP